MQSSEIVTAVVFALISIVVGFVLFRRVVDPKTLKLKPQILEVLKQSGVWLCSHKKQILTVIAIVVASGVVLALALRFTGPLIRAAGAIFSRPEPVSQPEALAESIQGEEPAAIEETAIIADHKAANEVRLDHLLPDAIERAKAKLHIFYVHGTHGSQIVYGMKGLVGYKGSQYAGLDMDNIELSDSSEADWPDWAERVRIYLKDQENANTNVVIWGWSNELSHATEQVVRDYLQLTTDLENEFKSVKFVYMTGHLDGTGLSGNLNQRNNQIRDYCRENDKILYDFADIESYDPDGNYYGDKSANDGCWYDSDGNGSLDRNWAREWSEANLGKWYDCYAAHTYPLNANLKAYAAWWLWAKLAEEEASDEGKRAD